MIKNLDKINPIKRHLVSDILSRVNGYPFLSKVVIFGSSIRSDCTENSDIDIALGWTEDCVDEDGVFKPFTLPVYEAISSVTKGNNDVVPIGYEGPLIKDAVERGTVVYELDVQ